MYHILASARASLERLAAAAVAPARSAGVDSGADPVGTALRGLAATTDAETAGEAMRCVAPIPWRGRWRERTLAALRGKVKAPAQLVDAALAVKPPPVAGKVGHFPILEEAR